MVYLSKIYTKTGDQGETGLGDGSRIRKDHPRINTIGSVDELNATLGLTLASAVDLDADIGLLLREIQNDLFDVGADLCVPQAADETSNKKLRIVPEQYLRLEAAIDKYNAALQPLKSFILPGGSVAAAWLHFARTVCRRAERDIVALARHESINKSALIYLNRLSDLLFVLARIANHNGQSDVLWEPGKSAGG